MPPVVLRLCPRWRWTGAFPGDAEVESLRNVWPAAWIFQPGYCLRRIMDQQQLSAGFSQGCEPGSYCSGLRVPQSLCLSGKEAADLGCEEWRAAL